MTSRPQADRASTPTQRLSGRRRWLLFVHQLPANSSNLRVRTWRRLQQLGAIPVKQAVYILPDTPSAREDFEWLTTEVKSSGGEASVFAADAVDTWSDDALVEEFRRSRQDDYLTLARDVEKAMKHVAVARRRGGTRAPTGRRLLNIFRERMAAIEGIDFFGSAGRDRVFGLLGQLDGHISPVSGSPRPSVRTNAGDMTAYHGRLWLTRPRPGVDRMASAWLIRRFVDPEARFGFAAGRDLVPEQAVPFDMFGVEFSHQGDGCTFETLCVVFGIREPALSRIAAIVHDLDLKDERFGAPECATVAAMIEGLQIACSDDDALLAQGMTLFDSLYRSFERTVQSAGPRPVARPKTARKRAEKTHPHSKGR